MWQSPDLVMIGVVVVLLLLVLLLLVGGGATFVLSDLSKMQKNL